MPSFFPDSLYAIIMITTLPLQDHRQLYIKFFLIYEIPNNIIDLMLILLLIFLKLLNRFTKHLILFSRFLQSLSSQFPQMLIFMYSFDILHRDHILQRFGINLRIFNLFVVHNDYKNKMGEGDKYGFFVIVKEYNYIVFFCIIWSIVIIMTSTCLLCYQENQFFVLPPCNHKDICWKCCLKLIDGSIFSCPFCKDKPEAKSQLLFVSTTEMQTKEYQNIMKSNPYRSNKNTFYFYSNKEVAEYIQSQTSFHCVQCGQVHETINFLKKHLNNVHRLQFCDVCLDNRRCIVTEQRLFNDGQLQVHLKQGDISETGQVILYHPGCDFCNKRFYDLQAFKYHLKASSHLKCQICDLNSNKLRYVYYKNYEELQRHFKKTHYICDVGDCVGKKLENVFASEALLEQHKRRCHRKYKGDKNEKVQNILLGFNKAAEQDHIEFDGIGKNLQREFNIFQRHEKVDKQSHNDELIDIREFYPEMVKNNTNIKVDEIIYKLEELHENYGNRAKEVRFNDMLLFKPLEMPPLSRGQCERLLRRCFPLRQAQAIIQIFFTKRHQYLSFAEYFQAIEKRMKNTSLFAFYLVFPQLVRFMKDQNKNKIPMDEHYGLKLKLLTVNRQLMCHVFDRYSHFLKFLKHQIQSQMINRCQNHTLDLDKYSKYMREMNINYYIENQEHIYFVPKQKCTNLYHMIERCKTRDFLKMNWLLKVGLPQEKYQHIMRNIYFKTREECSEKLFKPFLIKEIALIYLYLTICLQALLDDKMFDSHKKNPRSHYLTDFLATVPRPATISAKLLDELRNLQGHSNAIERKTKQRVHKALIIDEVDCPSLLKVQFQANPARKKPPEEPELGIGKSRLPIWNEEQSIRKKNLKIKPQQPQHNDQFPALSPPPETKSKKDSKNSKNAKKEQVEEEDFPIYNFNQKFVGKKANNTQKTTVRMQDFLGFNSKTVTNKWDQNRTRQKFDQINKEKEEIKQQQKRKKKEPQPKPTKLPSDDDDDEYLRMAIKESLKTAAQEQKNRGFEEPIKPKEEIIIPKKGKNIEEEPSFNKKNKKKNNSTEQKKPQIAQESPFLFDIIQKQAKMIEQKPKKSKLRVDYSDSEQQQRQTQPIQAPKPKSYPYKQPVIDQSGFMSIENKGGESIITKIQNQASSGQVQKIDKVVRNGKNGKKVIIQKVNRF